MLTICIVVTALPVNLSPGNKQAVHRVVFHCIAAAAVFVQLYVPIAKSMQ